MTEKLGGHDLDPHHETLNKIAEQAKTTAEMTQDGGVLAVLADIKLQADPVLAEKYGKGWHAPHQVFDIILARPERGEPLSPRWQLVEQLNQAVKDRINEHPENILAAALKLGMRRSGEVEDYSRVQASKALFIEEGGANKTSIVRRGVSEKALRAIYGEKLSGIAVFQLGSGRVISSTRADNTPNPEHQTIKGLAGDLLTSEAFTEFEANVATAIADGYEVESDQRDVNDKVARVISLICKDPKRPRRIAVQPTGPGLPGGFDAIATLVPMQGQQIVVATNGQYRSKDELQAHIWAKEGGIDMLPATALGDEPDDTFPFKGSEVVTPPRPAAAYVNEFAILGRSAAEAVVKIAKDEHIPGAATDLHGRQYYLPGHVIREDDAGNRFVVEPDGSAWQSYSRTSGLHYSGPHDDVGMYD